VTQAAAAVILYHAIALWIPTLGGTWGFVSLRRALAVLPPQAVAPQVVAPQAVQLSARDGLQNPRQYERADQHQNGGGERVAPAVKPT
jgi:hypothetical protein